MNSHAGIGSKHVIQVGKLVFKALVQRLQRTGSGRIRHQNIFQKRNDILADKVIDIQQDTAIDKGILHLLKLTADDPCQLVKHTLHSVDDVRIVKVDCGGGGGCRAGVRRSDLAFGLCQERCADCIGEILASDIHLNNTAADRSLTSTLNNIAGCTGATPHTDLTRNAIHIEVNHKIRHGLICNLDRAGTVTSCTPHGIYMICGFNDFIFTLIDSCRR